MRSSLLGASLSAQIIVAATSLLVMPGQTHEHQELTFFPLSQPSLVPILSFDEAAGKLRLEPAGEFYELLAGQHLSLKGAGAGPSATATRLEITFHGRLADIQPLDSDPR